MNASFEEGVTDSVREELNRKYWVPGSIQQKCFWWMWGELKQRCPRARCDWPSKRGQARTTPRYVGLYLERRLFARMDFQSNRILVGVRQDEYDRYARESGTPIRVEHFPHWGGPRDLVGFKLVEDPEVITLLEECYGRLESPRQREQRLLIQEQRRKEDIIRRSRADVAALKYEERALEGSRKTMTVTYAERNPKLRAEAIHFHGTKCAVCDFEFEQVYGDLGKLFIEVHHLKPLSDFKEGKEVEAKKDLVVVCANCHRIIHRNRRHTLSLEEIREAVERNRPRRPRL